MKTKSPKQELSISVGEPDADNEVMIELTPKKEDEKLQVELSLKLRRIANSKRYRDVPGVLIQNINWRTVKTNKSKASMRVYKLHGFTISRNRFEFRALKFVNNK